MAAMSASVGVGVIPAFATAMQDRALRGNPREVYLWCHEHLDLVEYRAVKLSAVEVELGLRHSSVADCMVRLVQHGYLARGESDGRLATYRLLYSRRNDAVASTRAFPQTGAVVVSR